MQRNVPFVSNYKLSMNLVFAFELNNSKCNSGILAFDEIDDQGIKNK
jgi:hypothetical protein